MVRDRVRDGVRDRVRHQVRASSRFVRLQVRHRALDERGYLHGYGQGVSVILMAFFMRKLYMASSHHERKG